MAYLKLNQEDKNAHTYTYAEIPEHYTYDRNNRKWDKRKQKDAFKIARIYFVQSKESESTAFSATSQSQPPITAKNRVKSSPSWRAPTSKP
ncbi:hypothetical protein EC957_009047 [Mortierella hygrophila]|uniref:Uncharacterized protein n=1 Tax=Mortierella hygrophila TaxID=979708 RepID=A0A9P6JXP8_9FUNG|nr:hypothetical protein EC957_009047 [Mortierella hygrophila]